MEGENNRTMRNRMPQPLIMINTNCNTSINNSNCYKKDDDYYMTISISIYMKRNQLMRVGSNIYKKSIECNKWQILKKKYQ